MDMPNCFPTKNNFIWGLSFNCMIEVSYSLPRTSSNFKKLMALLATLEQWELWKHTGFDVNDLSESASDDVEGLDASAAYVASLLANEPADIKLGVGGFSMGAATALYSATCFARGKYGNGNQFSANLRAIVGLSGWLPCAKTLTNKLEGINEAAARAASLPILLCHGIGDDVVAYRFGEKSAEKLSSSGFRDVTFKSYPSLGHYTIPDEMDAFCAWLTSKLGLDSK